MSSQLPRSSPPTPDGQGGIAWDVEVEGRTYRVTAFLDEAFGPEAPLFELPCTGEPLRAAAAVNAAFDDWTNHRDETDALLRAVAITAPAQRPLIPNAVPAGTQLTVTAIPERSYEVKSLGPPELTEREEVRLPVMVDGMALEATLSMVRLPGVENRVLHLGSVGTEDAALMNALMRYADTFHQTNRTAVDAMLAESHTRRLAAGLTDDDIDPPQPPRPRFATRATIASIFKTPGGRLVFTAALDGREQLITADSGGCLGGSSDPDCQNVVVYFILDNAQLMAKLGLNVESWDAWR